MADGAPDRVAVEVEIDEDNVFLTDLSRWRWNADLAAWTLADTTSNPRSVYRALSAFCLGESRGDAVAGELVELDPRAAAALLWQGRIALA